MSNGSLEEIFPDEGWSTDPDAAYESAVFKLVVVHVDLEAFNEARSFLSQLHIRTESEAVRFCIYIISRFQEYGIGGLEDLTKDPLFYDDKAKRILPHLLKHANQEQEWGASLRLILRLHELASAPNQ